jgi:hypothetical protein
MALSAWIAAQEWVCNGSVLCIAFALRTLMLRAAGIAIETGR